MSTPRKNPDNVQTVDVSKHGKLRVKADGDYPHAKEQHVVPVTMSEVAVCGSEFPLAFIQRPDGGGYMMVALLGMRPGENVYYAPGFWESAYVPLAVQRSPFLIGYDDRLPNGEEITTCLDMNSPYLSEKEGIVMFNEAGEQTDFLKSRHMLLNGIFESQKVTDRFIQTLTEHELLTPLQLQLQFQNGEVRNVAGLFTIDEPKLKSLNIEQIKAMHESDFLPPCYITLVSLHQLKRLIKLRNRKNPDQIVNFQLRFGAPQPTAEPPAQQ
jgi:hypothetical protein